MKPYTVAMISGGKDSTAMAIRLVEEGWHVDEWIFCDTGLEFPAMYDHLDRLEKYLSITIARLKSDRGFKYWMNEHVKTKGDDIGGVGYGWPQPHRWCKQALKTQVSDRYLRATKKERGVIEYHGVAVDEWNNQKKKHRAQNDNKKPVNYPLLFWAMSEADCLQLCYERGFDWGGLYEEFGRVSCFCCPHSSVPELRTIYHKYPELWAEMMRMDGGRHWLFKRDLPIQTWAKRFEKEEGELIEPEIVEVANLETSRQMSFGFVRHEA